MVNYLNDLTDEDYDISYQEESDWGQGFTGAIMITNKSDRTIEDWQLQFTMKRNITHFWSAALLEKSGNIYTIKNSGFNSNIEPGASLRVGIMGTGGSKGDTILSHQLRHIEWKYYTKADTDRDGLSNESELSIGSNACKMDTDGDGLDDGYEYSVLETNPCLKDSDNNGVNDDKEDFDKDMLTNIQEYDNETDPLEDNDGLTDCEEVGVFGKTVYSGTLSEGAGMIILRNYPWLMALWSAAIDFVKENEGMESCTRGFLVSVFLNAAEMKTKNNKEWARVIKDFSKAKSVIDLMNRYQTSGIKESDRLIYICVDRGKTRYGGCFRSQTFKEFVYDDKMDEAKATSLYWACPTEDDAS